jgi:two-component system, LuxR family, response regulator FixJ
MILIVEDDEGVREALRFSLATEGHAVRTFASAASILAARDLPESGCLVFDYRLPGMNGLDLLTELRRRGVRLPAVLITTLPSNGLRAQAAAAHVPIIEKPLTGDALSNWVRESLSKTERSHGQASDR